MSQNIIAVNFNNQSLFATLIDNVPYVAVKPICESLGIDWEAQRQKINRHPILKEGACMIKAPSNGGIQEMLMLPIRMLNGWLFGIDSSRVKSEAKEAVLKYQRECFDVLANHFMPKRNALVDLPTATPKTITPVMQRQVQKAIANLVRSQVGTTYSGLYGQIKDKFGVGTYKDVPFKRYGELCEFLNIEPIVQTDMVDLSQIEILDPNEKVVQVRSGQIIKMEDFIEQVFSDPNNPYVMVKRDVMKAIRTLFNGLF